MSCVLRPNKPVGRYWATLQYSGVHSGGPWRPGSRDDPPPFQAGNPATPDHPKASPYPGPQSEVETSRWLPGPPSARILGSGTRVRVATVSRCDRRPATAGRLCVMSRESRVASREQPNCSSMENRSVRLSAASEPVSVPNRCSIETARSGSQRRAVSEAPISMAPSCG